MTTELTTTLPSELDLRKFFAPNASEKEFYEFAQLCRLRNLNPVLKEVYFIKYGSGPGQIVVGKDAILKRAKSQASYRGFDAGYILKSGQASAFPVGEIVGAYCDVFLAGYERPVRSVAMMGEYDTHQSLWKSKPLTMIRKVAIVQAHREAFPEEFAGMYQPEEMGVDLPEVKNVTPPEPQPEKKPELVTPESVKMDWRGYFRDMFRNCSSVEQLKEAFEEANKLAKEGKFPESVFREIEAEKDYRKEKY